MNHTTNYSLPQWEASDVVTREDVNGAMSSIDTAMAAGASPLVKLIDYIAPEETTQIDIDLTHINFMDYWQIFMYFHPGSCTAQMKFNNYMGNYKRYPHGGTTATIVDRIDLAKEDTWLAFHPVNGYYVTLSTITLATTQKAVDYVLPFSWVSWNSVTFFGSDLPQGSRVAMFGIKR